VRFASTRTALRPPQQQPRVLRHHHLGRLAPHAWQRVKTFSSRHTGHSHSSISVPTSPPSSSLRSPGKSKSCANTRRAACIAIAQQAPNKQTRTHGQQSSTHAHTKLGGCCVQNQAKEQLSARTNTHFVCPRLSVDFLRHLLRVESRGWRIVSELHSLKACVGIR
jgi:hypothetical protein